MNEPFFWLGESPSLRRLLVEVQRQIGLENERWGQYVALWTRAGRYVCSSLSFLAQELAQGTWSLDTPLTDFPSSLRAVRLTPAGNEPYRLTERNGQPDMLERLGPPLIGGNAAGWWHLVGEYMAELEQLPAWPDLTPLGWQQIAVVGASSDETLGELAQRLQAVQVADQTMLAMTGADRWQVFTLADFRRHVEGKSPAPGGNSQVGALLVGLSSSDVPAVMREKTPWPLLQEMMNRRAGQGVLVIKGGQPDSVLTQTMRGGAGGPMRGEPTVASLGYTPGPVAKGITARTSSPGDFWAALAQAQPGQDDHGRVVNAWLGDSFGRRVEHVNALSVNREYLLGMNIGLPDERAHTLGERPEVDARVVRYAIAQGKSLTLRLDSQDFVVLESEKTIELPAVGNTADVLFRLVTPMRVGLSSLRLRLYFENNLVQSHRLYAWIAPVEGPLLPQGRRDGWWSECEYTLSAHLTDLKTLEPRRVCIWVGEGRPDERAAVEDAAAREGVLRAQQVGLSGPAGLDLGELPPLNVRLIEEALARYREILLGGCFSDQEKLNDGYLYDKDLHTPTRVETFTQNIKSLAEMGQMLYQRVLGQVGGDRVRQALVEAERTSEQPLVVQVARLSLDMAFPWAVLYDRPLRYHTRRNVVCTDLADIPNCRATCGKDDNTICPLGFWGLRYIIEQPLRPPRRHTSLVTRLSAQPRTRLALVYGSRLALAEEHRQRVNGIVAGRADCALYGRSAGTTDALLRDMAAGNTALAYFYCHGGNAAFRQWLLVSDDDPLLPSYLDDELSRAWQAGAAPLVFLNGCHTAQYTPGAFISFVHRFAAVGAAGVVGTEVPIHEYLGRFAGEFFVERFLAHQPVGQIVYDLRLELVRRKNFLGLVYVPYCYASLRLDEEVTA